MKTIDKLTINNSLIMHPEFQKLTDNFKKEILALDLGFNEDLFIRIESSYVGLGILNENKDYWQFASEITIQPDQDNFLGKRKAKINFGSSGGFDPEDKAAYWRTIHGAIVLQNWNTIIPIVNKYCGEWEKESKKDSIL